MPGELEDLARAVEGWFAARAARFGLRAQAIQARYVLNFGGFGHPSFTVGDGRPAYHVKLDAELATWRRLAPRLAAEYRAPRLLDWLEIDGHAGAVFKHVAGAHADFARAPWLLGECVALLERLHADRSLAADLPDAGTLADHACDYFLGTCRADLDENPSVVTLVGAATVGWMRAELDRVEGVLRGTASFGTPARAAVHGDPWANNVLVRPDGEWFVVDWDDLRRGDPVVDLAILLWRTPGAERFVDALGASERERFALLSRCLLLTDAIDSLADFVEAERAPEHAAEVRAAKWRVHIDALREYRARY